MNESTSIKFYDNYKHKQIIDQKVLFIHKHESKSIQLMDYVMKFRCSCVY